MEPGPFWNRPALPDDPWPTLPGGFLSLAGPVTDLTSSGRPVILAARDQVGADIPGDPDAVYAVTVAVAQDAHANALSNGGDSRAAALTDAGGGIDAHRNAALPYLPSPDTGITQNFRDPGPVPQPGGPDNQSPYTGPPQI